MPLAVPDVDRLFTVGSTYPYPNGQIGTVVDLPSVELDLPTGRVFACDPFVGLYEEAVAFTTSVAPGTYTVAVSMVEITDPARPSTGHPHHRVAAARLRVLDRPVAAWEPGLTDGQDIVELEGDGFYGYGVDAGTGCFVDVAVAGALAAYQDESDALMDALDGGGEQRILALVTDPDTGHSVALFPSGWGDGAYPTWIGRTAGGEVACFVTEFFVVPDECTKN